MTPAVGAEPGPAEAASRRIDRITDAFDRVLPFRRFRPLDAIPSIKVKLSILIVAAIVITVAASAAGLALNIKPRYSLLTAVILALALVQILARGLTSPLRAMASAADRMAYGDLDQRVAADSADEVGQLARSFNRMAGQISDLERQRRDLLADVGHELRSPLTVLRGSLENLDDGITDPAQTVPAMLRQTRRLEGLVEQLLDLSRLEAGVKPLTLRPVAMADVLDDVVEELQLRVPPPRLSVCVTDETALLGDPERLHQVVVNLVDNAIRFAPGNEPIDVLVERCGAEVILTISDKGPGIPADELPTVFERFHAGDTPTGSERGGTGLGLAITRSIVELHGGTVAAANRDPIGCTFIVRLPATTPPA